MGSLRHERLTHFREDILAGKRDSDANLFRVLYGVPADVQIELAREVTARFVPIFLKNHPGDAWAAEVVHDLEHYYRENEQGLPDPLPDCFGGDSAFLGALWGLLRTWFYATRNELPRVTPACCTTVNWAIAARVDNVWYADDPEAVQAFDDRDYEAEYGRTPGFNVASIAVRKREWLWVADWLEQHQVADHPDTEDEEREKWFEWWIDRECNL